MTANRRRRAELVTAFAASAICVGVVIVPGERHLTDVSTEVAALGERIAVARRATGVATPIERRWHDVRERVDPAAVPRDAASAERTLSRVVPAIAAAEHVHVSLVQIGSAATVPSASPAPAPAASSAADAGTVAVVLQIEGGYDALRRFMARLPHDVPMLEERSWSYASADRAVAAAGDRLAVTLSCTLHVVPDDARQALAVR